MEKVLQMQRQLLRWKRLPLLVIALTLAVLGGTILLASLHLRRTIREQIVNRDGEILQAVSLMQQYEDEANGEMLGSLDDPAEQFTHILKISRLKGVLGIRLFTAQGAFANAFPGYIEEAALAPGDLDRLQTLKPVSHFDPKAPLEKVDMLASIEGPAGTVPLLEVNVPLQATNQTRLLGVAQFLIQGDSIARDYSVLDRNLAAQASAAFLVGGAFLAITILLSFGGIQRANQQLALQAERLLRANQELTLAAKTSAVGAVASHLIHGLKNPLSGLSGFVKNHASGQAAESEADWQDAVATAQRMQTLIGGVVRILEEQQAAGHYEISLRELVEIISARMLPVARAAGIHFYTQLRVEGVLANREANLMILILENLVQNALHATPEGRSVRLLVSAAEEKVRFEVQDEGSGFPVELLPKLFSPCHSQKAGGSGIGLAISKQLALNIGAELELKTTGSHGCVFCLSLPQKLTLPNLISPESIQH